MSAFGTEPDKMPTLTRNQDFSAQLEALQKENEARQVTISQLQHAMEKFKIWQEKCHATVESHNHRISEQESCIIENAKNTEFLGSKLQDIQEVKTDFSDLKSEMNAISTADAQKLLSQDETAFPLGDSKSDKITLEIIRKPESIPKYNGKDLISFFIEKVMTYARDNAQTTAIQVSKWLHHTLSTYVSRGILDEIMHKILLKNSSIKILIF